MNGTANANAFTVNGIPVQSSSDTNWIYSTEDIYTQNDAIIDGSLAVGDDSYPGIEFDFNTLILRDKDIRIFFDDTSSTDSFPRNDWRITLNDRENAAANYFAIDDATAGTRPFVIEAGAPDHALYIANGKVGIGTASPQSSLQVNGYLQLALTSGQPPAGDCDESTEIGRMKVDSTAELLYLCTSTGWSSK